jgi:hypothetical protein
MPTNQDELPTEFSKASELPRLTDEEREAIEADPYLTVQEVREHRSEEA